MKKARFKKIAKNTAYLLAYAIDVVLIAAEIALIIWWISTSFNSINAIYRWLKMNVLIHYTQRTRIGEIPQTMIAKKLESCFSLAENKLYIKADDKATILNNCKLLGMKEIK